MIRTTWAQVKRARTYLNETGRGNLIAAPKSEAHLARIARRKLTRIARKQTLDAVKAVIASKLAASRS